jgi:hypothetical protein
MSTASMITLASLPRCIHCSGAYSGASLWSAYTPKAGPRPDRIRRPKRA